MIIFVICLTFLLIAVVFLAIPVRFTGIIDEGYPEKLIQGEISGLVLSANVYVMPDRTHKRHKNVTISLKERIYMTFALRNPRFDASCLINYVEHPDNVIATRDKNERLWNEIYAECDLNRDGKITRREFAYWIIKKVRSVANKAFLGV